MTQQEPRTQQIATDLRRQIANGTLGPGALLRSEPELARDHGVSRQTARAACPGKIIRVGTRSLCPPENYSGLISSLRCLMVVHTCWGCDYQDSWEGSRP